MIPGGDALDYHTDPLIHFREQRQESRIIAEQREERRLVCDQPSDELGTLAGQPKRDRSAERVADDASSSPMRRL
jgi:hypothetical protein